MVKEPNFAIELESISDSVEADVNRVINLLLDGNTIPSTEIHGSQDLSQQRSPLQINRVYHGRSENKRQAKPPPIQPPPIDEAFESGRLLDNVTTRLTRETNSRLTDAALREKLAKQLPNYRQAIIESAVNDWLQRN